MKFQPARMSTSENFINFVVCRESARRQRGELPGFCPSENLENSREKAKRLNAAPPVYSYFRIRYHYGSSANIYGCELKFHSFFTGNSRTF